MICGTVRPFRRDAEPEIPVEVGRHRTGWGRLKQAGAFVAGHRHPRAHLLHAADRDLVLAELERRTGRSGIAEKAARELEDRLAAGAAALVGCFAYLRHRSLAADVVAHALLPGLCLGYLLAGERSLPLLLAYLLTGILGYQLLPFASHLGAQWLLLLLAVVATLAGMSQLHFMSQLVDQSSHDGLTRAYNRRVGEEMLVQQFLTSMRSKTPFALAFVDLDNFKSINDRYGHEEGDNTLRAASAALRKVLRRGDVLIRWGGEEFLLLMPGTDLPGARIALERLRAVGLGTRPDGMPLTASIGVAERAADGAASWQDLIATADGRMYQAKQGGRDRIVG